MNLSFLVQKNNTHLMLFFSGWGMDSAPFLPKTYPAHDVAICYDYRSLAVDWRVLKRYDTISILGWSMGVWAASQSAHPLLPRLQSALAFNGTPTPISDTLGIKNEFFEASIRALDERIRDRFYRLMCGVHVKEFRTHMPTRSLHSLAQELQAIKAQSKQNPPKDFPWDKIIIGEKDRIFLPQN